MKGIPTLVTGRPMRAQCEEVATARAPGSALIIDRVRMALCWAFVETEVEVALSGALSMQAPTSCPSR